MRLLRKVARYPGFVLLCFAAILVLVAVGAAGCEETASPPPPAPAPESSPEPAKIGLSPTTLSFDFKKDDKSTSTKNITLSNQGATVMVWAARESASWLWLDVTDGTIYGGFSQNLQLFVSPARMAPGTYTDNITFEGAGASNSPQVLQVKMVVSTESTETTGSNAAPPKKAVPPPPWAYNEYKNDIYQFVLKYPKDYKPKQLSVTGAVFGAVSTSANQQEADNIMVVVASAIGLDAKAAAEEAVKNAVRLLGGRPNPRLMSEATTTLADGTTSAYELTYESRSAASPSFQCYIFGVHARNRYIFFGGISPLASAPEKMELWKQIGRTLEFTY